ncbi:MAG: hypothetical protein M1819_007117 [Sarea resinae]|nr:MAG: hypothetical protein M1819_007117 [Sarea resinae]
MADDLDFQDILQRIQREWNFMTEDNCVPVQVALQLMDSSSLGRAYQYEQFQETHRQLQKALKAIVNEHHQGFNSSIGTFHKIQSSIQTSQGRVRTLKESLIRAKSDLASTKPELKGLATSSQSYDVMLQALGNIEQLQLIPEKLEARISEKRFLTAVDVLQDALRMIRKSEMESIGALSDLRVYLSNQETSLVDILVEELHSHLYLKSPYCQDRWKAYGEEQAKESMGGNVRPVHVFLDSLSTSAPMVEDASRNPEADSFYYIQMIIESLNKMGRLDFAVDKIEQRLPVELFKVVEKTNNDVDQRHPSALRKSRRRNQDGLDLGAVENDIRSAIIYDFLWTLYSKFEAIAEGHRVVHDVVTGIVKREGLRNSSSLTGGFKELWKLYQSEIRSILHDYLATDGEVSHRSAQGGGNYHRNQRDRNKRMFKLSDMSNKSPDLTMEQDDLEFILKESVPGLVSDSRRPAGVLTSDNLAHPDGSATGHKLLIEPSVFNMGLLLPPSLGFLQRLKSIVPSGADIVTSTLTSFLDDFLVNVFHPQLDETLMDLCAQTFIELDAFQQDQQWFNHAQRPIFKGTLAFFNLITVFCKMLDTIPHDQSFSQLIIGQMVTYYDKCCGWYKTLVTRAQAQAQGGIRPKASASLAEPGEMHDILMELWNEKDGDNPDLIQKEIDLLISTTNAKPLEPLDMIFDRKAYASMCLLYTSMRWLAKKISRLRSISDHSPETSSHESGAGGKPRSARRWTLVNPAIPRNESSPIYLPMTPESVVAFDGVVTSYEDLATTVLLTLHLEVRVHIIYYISQSLSTNYLFEQAVNEADPAVLSLNADLVAFDEDIATHIRDEEHEFILTPASLSPLITTTLISTATRIPAMNAHGLTRMSLNILVLQQNLKNLTHSATTSLARAEHYYNLFSAGPDAMVERAKRMVRRREKGKRKEVGSGAAAGPKKGTGAGAGEEEEEYTYEQLKVLVELFYSEALRSGRREVVMAAKRGVNDHLLQLSEFLWQT